MTVLPVDLAAAAVVAGAVLLLLCPVGLVADALAHHWCVAWESREGRLEDLPEGRAPGGDQ